VIRPLRGKQASYMKLDTDESYLDWIENKTGAKRIAAKHRFEYHDFMAEAYLAMIQRGWKKHILAGDVAFINRSLKNLAIDMLRSKRYRPWLATADCDDQESIRDANSHALDATLVNEAQIVCRDAVKHLPDWLRIAVQMVWLDGQSVRDCAKELRTTPASVRSRLRKAFVELELAPMLSKYRN